MRPSFTENERKDLYASEIIKKYGDEKKILRVTNE